MFYRSSTD